jgi:putative transposase
VRLIVTTGPRHDLSRAKDLIQDQEAEDVSAAQGEDSPAFVAALEAPGARAVIPPRSHRETLRHSDAHLDQERTRVERFLTRVKSFGRVATRSEKTARNFLAFWQFVSVMVLLL